MGMRSNDGRKNRKDNPQVCEEGRISMAYIVVIPMEYRCKGFNKKHILTLKNSFAKTEAESVRLAEILIANTKEGYAASGWTVTDDGTGFTGENNGNLNIYGDYIVHEIK